MTDSYMSALSPFSTDSAPQAPPLPSSGEDTDIASTQYHKRSADDNTNSPTLSHSEVLKVTSGVSSVVAGRKRQGETDLVQFALERSQRARLSVEKQRNAQDFAQVCLCVHCYVVVLNLTPALILLCDT